MRSEIRLGKYRHFKGGEYELIAIARDSETLADMAVYKALYGDGELWIRPISMWNEFVIVNGESVQRFTYIGDSLPK